MSVNENIFKTTFKKILTPFTTGRYSQPRSIWTPLIRQFSLDRHYLMDITPLTTKIKCPLNQSSLWIHRKKSAYFSVEWSGSDCTCHASFPNVLKHGILEKIVIGRLSTMIYFQRVFLKGFNFLTKKKRFYHEKKSFFVSAISNQSLAHFSACTRWCIIPASKQKACSPAERPAQLRTYCGLRNLLRKKNKN